MSAIGEQERRHNSSKNNGFFQDGSSSSSPFSYWYFQFLLFFSLKKWASILCHSPSVWRALFSISYIEGRLTTWVHILLSEKYLYFAFFLNNFDWIQKSGLTYIFKIPVLPGINPLSWDLRHLWRLLHLCLICEFSICNVSFSSGCFRNFSSLLVYTRLPW